ncbi:hypothetical protein KVT40_005568 [Elsinoe batatas]|uniref:Uncharacterized protein n=1 Tax=Elsinoe batatas TaxID=2601811 RepID=A0A8K0PGR1_9PEZI|nr:hypothetical protein KVT40_005568 [Elsinoe batatas]
MATCSLIEPRVSSSLDVLFTIRGHRMQATTFDWTHISPALKLALATLLFYIASIWPWSAPIGFLHTTLTAVVRMMLPYPFFTLASLAALSQANPVQGKSNAAPSAPMAQPIPQIQAELSITFKSTSMCTGTSQGYPSKDRIILGQCTTSNYAFGMTFNEVAPNSNQFILDIRLGYRENGKDYFAAYHTTVKVPMSVMGGDKVDLGPPAEVTTRPGSTTEQLVWEAIYWDPAGTPAPIAPGSCTSAQQCAMQYG